MPLSPNILFGIIFTTMGLTSLASGAFRWIWLWKLGRLSWLNQNLDKPEHVAYVGKVHIFWGYLISVSGFAVLANELSGQTNNIWAVSFGLLVTTLITLILFALRRGMKNTPN